jgi:hypothetical protein
VYGSESHGSFKAFGSPFAPSPLDRALSFDGVKIRRSQDAVLVPDGWVEYGDRPKSQRVLFKLGQRVQGLDASHAGEQAAAPDGTGPR